MMLNTKWAVLLITVVTLSLGAFVQTASAKDMDKEVQKLQGTWVMSAGERDGEKLSNENVKNSKIIYDGKTLTLVTPHQSKEPIIADIKDIDVTEKGNVMHFVRRTGPNEGKEMTGAYRFNGADEYVFVYDPTGKTTPTEFTTKKGSGHVAHTWKKVK